MRGSVRSSGSANPANHSRAALSIRAQSWGPSNGCLQCGVTRIFGREADTSMSIKGGSDVPLVAADPQIILRAVNTEAAPVPPSQHPT